MSFGRLILRKHDLWHDGRRYTVRAPTYATVYMALSLYPVEAAAIAQQFKLHPAIIGFDVVAASITFDRRAVEVLSTCVDTAEPPERWPIEILARACIALADVETIVEAIGVDRLAEVTASDLIDRDRADAVTRETVGLVHLAHLFHKSPGEICDWPFETVIETWRALVDMGVIEERREDEFLEICRANAKPAEA